MVRIEGLNHTEEVKCSDCQKGKSKTTFMMGRYQSMNISFRQLLAFGYWCVHAEASASGNKHFLLCKCEHTKFLKVFMLKKKSDALAAVTKLVNHAPIETGNKVVHLHSD